MSNLEPQYFKTVTLGDFLIELPKSTLPASIASESGAYPFYCSSSVIKYCNTFIQDKPTVLMGTGGTASVNFGNDKFAYSTDTWAFRSSDEEELKTEYIYRLIQHKLSKIDYFAFEGSGLKHLRKNDVKKLRFRVPANKRVTNKILSILRNLDGAIEETESLIEKYQQIKTGLMHDLFTRGIGADGKLRPPREQAPELYQHTPIGWIPNEWEMKNIKTALSIHNNLRLPLSSEVREKMKGPYRYYGPTGILDYLNEYRVEGKFVLIGEDGDHFLKSDRMEMTQLIDGKFNVNNHAHILQGNEFCTSEWFYIFYMHRDITYWLTRQGAGRYKLNKSTLEKLPIAVPSPNEQLHIVNQILSFKKFLDIQQDNLIKLKKQKSGLMHDLLTGKVQVPINTAEAAHV